MIKQTIALLCIILIMPTALADDVEYDPGLITPASFLWELDLRIERLQEQFAWNDAHRTALQIKHLNERIGEMETGEKRDKVVQHYTDAITRIEENTQRYEAVEQVRNTFLLHMAEIYEMTADNETALMTQVRERIMSGDQTLEETADQIIIDEQVWWANKVAEYQIISTPTPINNYGNFGKYAKHLNDGNTIVEIVNSEGTLMQSYTITKTVPVEPDAVMEPITIRIGTVTNFVEKHTFTIEQLQKYDAVCS